MRAYRPSEFPDIPSSESMAPEGFDRRIELIEFYAWRVAAGLPLFEQDALGELGGSALAVGVLAG